MNAGKIYAIVDANNTLVATLVCEPQQLEGNLRKWMVAQGRELRALEDDERATALSAAPDTDYEWDAPTQSWQPKTEALVRAERARQLLSVEAGRIRAMREAIIEIGTALKLESTALERLKAADQEIAVLRTEL